MIPSILNKLLNYDCLIFILDLKRAELIYMSKILEIGLHEFTISTSTNVQGRPEN